MFRPDLVEQQSVDDEEREEHARGGAGDDGGDLGGDGPDALLRCVNVDDGGEEAGGAIEDARAGGSVRLGS